MNPIGYLTSPSYPNVYPNDKICVYTIAQPEDTYIIIRVLQFNLIFSQGCNEDYLEIRDGYTRESPLIGQFCGNELHINQTIMSTQNNMLLK